MKMNKKGMIIPMGFMGVDSGSGGATIVGSATLATSLYHYYKFDVNSGTQTDEIGNDNATVNGAVYTASGKLNGAYDYDGAADTISASPTGIQVNDYSWSAWIKADALAGGIVVVGDDTAADHLFDIASNKLRFTSRDNPSATVTATGATTLSTGTWYHVVAVRDSVELRIKIFLDGVLDAIATIGNATARYPGTPEFKMGERATTYYDGIIDEVGIWTKALTDGSTTTVGVTAGGEIAELYNGGTVLPYD